MNKVYHPPPLRKGVFGACQGSAALHTGTTLRFVVWGVVYFWERNAYVWFEARLIYSHRLICLDFMQTKQA